MLTQHGGCSCFCLGGHGQGRIPIQQDGAVNASSARLANPQVRLAAGPCQKRLFGFSEEPEAQENVMFDGAMLGRAGARQRPCWEDSGRPNQTKLAGFTKPIY